MGKSSGVDGILPEHMVYGGEMLKVWLKHILTLEEFPDCFKKGIVVPIYKRQGKDPLLVNSYLYYHSSYQKFWKSFSATPLPYSKRQSLSRSAANCLSERHFMHRRHLCHPRDSHVSPSRWWPALSMSF